MRWLGRKLASFLWWTYPRGSFEYDVMVAVILAFIFLTPRSFLRDQPRPHQIPGLAFAAVTYPARYPAAPQFLPALYTHAPLAPTYAAVHTIWNRHAQAPATLAAVLQELTAAAPTIHSVSAKADVADYTALVQDTTRSSGHLYFTRTPAGPMYSLDLDQPAASAKRLVYRDHTGYVYTPSSKQVLKYPVGGNQDLVNQLLLLGMGSTGADLTSSFQVTLAGPQKLDGAATLELDLTPTAADLKTKFQQLKLWYNPKTWVAVQQQILQPGGDYHLVHYSDIKLNSRLDDNLFSTNFSGATVVTPHP